MPPELLTLTHHIIVDYVPYIEPAPTPNDMF